MAMELLKTGLDYLAPTGLIFPTQLVTSLETGRSQDYTGVWYHDKSALAPFQQEMMVRYMQNKMIPKLAEDPTTHAMGLAVGLAYVDARTLAGDVRVKIGLNEEAPRQDNQIEYPTLFAPADIKEWAFLCGMSEHYLERTLLSLKGDTAPAYEDTGFTFLGCLQGKRHSIISGLCTQTTEFPNGSVFVKDVWYMLRGRMSPELTMDILGKPATEKLIEMPECGGVWQPARVLNTSHPVAQYFS